MFEFLFPIFCFGVVVTAIVLKGLMLAFEENQLRKDPKFDAESWKILRAFRVIPAANEKINGSTATAARQNSYE